jgi:GDPmannose 4,6-dehydratase
VTNSVRRALITGLTGQDGSFLAQMLLDLGYSVTGLVRNPHDGDLGSAEHLRDRVELLSGDLLSPATFVDAVIELRPHEIYHFAAPTFVPDCWKEPTYTICAIVGSASALLEAVRDHSPSTRLLIAGSGEMFGDASRSPQDLSTNCNPRNPYATAKLAAYHLVSQIRGNADIFACTAILYNHESERRPEAFVSRKITRAAAAIKLGLADQLVLGDVTAIRDWSFAGDIVRGCWLMLQQTNACDYILASGIGHTVQDLLDAAFSHVGLDPAKHVRIDEQFVRAPELTRLVGDPSPAHTELNWTPTLTFEDLVGRMVDADLRELEA